MLTRTNLLLGLFFALAAATPAGVSAQTFHPIADGYDCVRFPDGLQKLSRSTSTGFEVLKSNQVRNQYSNESKQIRRRLKTIDNMLVKLAQDRVNKSKLLKLTNKIVVKIFGEPEVPDVIPESELELKFIGLESRLEERLALNATILSLIDDCLAGENLEGGTGTPLSPTVTAVSIQGTMQGVFYGGWVASTAPQLGQFMSEPGGYTACVKITSQDGSIRRNYDGMGDEDRCGIGTFVFDTASPVACDALIPSGQVGVVRESVSILDLTGTRTAEQILQDARLQAEATLPEVSVLAFLTENLTRDEEIALCNAF